MRINDWIDVTMADQDNEILLGFYNQALIGVKVDEEGKEIEGEPEMQFNRFVIGLLLFNISFFYR